MKEHGDFEGALATIERRLACGNTPAALRYALTAQAEMIRRLPGNFPYGRGEALDLVRAHIADFSADEFDEMVRGGRVEWIYVNGEPRYFGRFFETLCKVDARFAARAGVAPAGTEPPDENGESRLDRAARLMREKGSMAVRFRCRASLRIKDELFRPGMKVGAALPLPCACPSQSGVAIDLVSPRASLLAPEDAPQRVVVWNETMEWNHDFSVEFSFTRRQNFADLSRAPRRPCGETPRLDDTAELPPHVLFSPFMKSLAREIAGSAETALEKARRFYDFITLNVKYRFMPDYFCLEDIAANCARSLTGDCGGHTGALGKRLGDAAELLQRTRLDDVLRAPVRLALRRSVLRRRRGARRERGASAILFRPSRPVAHGGQHGLSGGFPRAVGGLALRSVRQPVGRNDLRRARPALV